MHCCQCFLIAQQLSIPSTMVLLLTHLARMDLGGPVYWWFRSFLDGRLQKMFVCVCCPVPLAYRVLKGSILSSLLVNILHETAMEVSRQMNCHVTLNLTVHFWSCRSGQGAFWKFSSMHLFLQLIPEVGRT